MTNLSELFGGGGIEVIHTEIITASTTWVPPENLEPTDFVRVEMWGGGQGGGRSGATGESASGGQGGPYAQLLFEARHIPDEVPIVIGAGGASILASVHQPEGNLGGTTSFLGCATPVQGSGSEFLMPSGVLYNYSIGAGTSSMVLAYPFKRIDFPAVGNSNWAMQFGGGRGGTANNNSSQSGQASKFGARGGDSNNVSGQNAQNGAPRGGGGGGKWGTGNSGAGGRGEIEIAIFRGIFV